MYNVQRMEAIVDTKGTAKGFKFILVILGIIMIIGGFILSMRTFPEKTGNDETEFMMKMFLSLIPTLVGCLVFCLPIIWSGTRILVYDDHVEGRGICGPVVKNSKEQFYADYGRISNITIGAYNIITINIGNQSYKVLTNREKAEQVYNYCNKMRNRAYV